MATNVKLPFKKETKNTLQYHSEEESAIPTLYVRKDMFDSSKPWPKFLKITVEGVNK